jgi:NAD(P)-dependent dehydrogenase (short-subunit alcohol dehydrogenase family)
MTAATLAGRTVLVIGASAGIGRSFATRAVQSGAEVVVVARRADRLEALVTEAGTCTTLAVDISRPDQLGRIADTMEGIGTLDLVLFSAGSAPLRTIRETTADDWDSVMRTNVVGFNDVVRTLLPHLSPHAVVAALSSESVHQPRDALLAYSASKAALEASIRGWRLEHPEIRFSCIRVGATFPTEFGDAFEGAVLGPVYQQWGTRGLLQEEMMDTDEVAAVLFDTLAVLIDHPGVAMEDVVVRSPSPIVGLAPPPNGD